MQVFLKIKPLTKESFSAFGDVIEIEGAEHFSINAGTIERYHNLADVDLGPDSEGRALISIVTCNTVSSLPYNITLMERHPLGSQAFIPTDDTPLVIAVAPIGDKVNVNDIEVFLSNGKQGVNYKRGMWHMPLITLNARQQLICIDRGGPGNNCDEYPLNDDSIVIIEE